MNNKKNNTIAITARAIVSPLGMGITNYSKNIKNCLKTKKKPKINKKQFAKTVESLLEKLSINRTDLDQLSCYLLLAAEQLKRDAGNMPKGIVFGTAFSSAISIFDFGDTAQNKGYNQTRPALFPNTVLSMPANRVAIKYQTTALCETLSNGLCSGLDALGQACSYLQNNQAKELLCAGGEEFNKAFPLFLGDNSARSLNFQEGVGLVVLEKTISAIKKNHHIYAEIVDYKTNKGPDLTKNIEENIYSILNKTNLIPADIAWILSSKSSMALTNKAELVALKNIFGTGKIPEIALKKYIGEGAGLSGLQQVFLATELLKTNITTRSSSHNILINNVHPTGSVSSLLLRKHNTND